MKKLIFGCVVAFAVGSAFAATVNVPGDYATVEAAVAAAQSGDEVVLATSASPYVMTDAISVASGVVVRGASGSWGDVTLDFSGVKNKRGVTLQAGATLAALTVSGGNYGGSGAGVYVAGADAVLTNCRITACKSANTSGGNYTPAGGAVANNGGLVTHCVIDGNGRYDTYTGNHANIAYHSLVAAAVMDSCVITNNVDPYGQTSGTLGKSGCISGMVMVKAGVVRKTLIADNDVGPITFASADAHGIALGVSANATIENCTIVRNRYVGLVRSYLYGAYAVSAKTITFRNNVVADNRAWGADESRDLLLGASVVQSDNYTDCLGSLGVGDVSLPATTCAAAGAFPSNVTGFACSFSAGDRTPFVGTSTTLAANVQEAPGAVTYAWDLDGDGVWDPDVFGQVITYTPATVGRHWIGLKVTSGGTAVTFRGAVDVLQKTFYVDDDSANPTAPYATAATAAHSPADALALAMKNEGAEVRVKAGTYALTASLAVGHAVRVVGDETDRETVVLSGPSAARTVSLTGIGATLANAKVTAGYGVSAAWGSVVTNCRATASTKDANASGLGIYNLASSVFDCTMDAITGNSRTKGAYCQEDAAALADRCVISNCVNPNIINGSSWPCYAGVWLAGGEMRNSYITDIRCTWGKGEDAANGGGAALVVNSGATFVNGAVLNTTVTSSTAYGHPVRVDAGGILLNSILNGNTRNTAADDSYGGGTYTNSYLSSVTDAQAANGCVALKGDEYVRTPGGLYTVPDTSPLIDKGADTAWMNDGGLDVAGNPRCVNARLDIGAVENQKEKSAFWCRIDTEQATGIGRLRTTLAAYQEGAAGDVTYYWDLDGDGQYEITNRTSVVYDSSAVGTVTVSLKAEDGVSDPATYALDLTVLQGVYYVDASGTDPVPPYDTWAHAATNIADAVALMDDGAEVRLAAGEYTLTNTVELTGGSRLAGAGPTRDDVVVRGTGKRLFKLNGAGTTLANVTLTRLPSAEVVNGGAVYANAGTVVTNCLVTNPTFVFACDNDSPYGYAIYSLDARVVDCEFRDITVNQGVYGIALYQAGDNALADRCVLRNLTTTWWANGSTWPCCGGIVVAGGTVRNTLVTDCRINTVLTKSYNIGAWIQNNGCVENCTVVDTVMGTGYYNLSCSNKTAAVSGAGSFTNCLVYGNLTLGLQKNWNPSHPNGEQDYAYCCTTTDGLVGEGNVEATPGCYWKRANGRVLVKSTSPCYNAGTNQTWMAGATDLYGTPRILHDRVDIGAAESTAGGLMMLVR